ncbi:MAG: non-canonical purine NTP pyrophosphatase [Alphaproteobacteria bacterium]
MFEKIIIACSNEEKVSELKELLKGLGIEAVSAKSMKIPGVERLGKNLHECGALFAQQIADETGLPCITEDSGISVSALGGKPGLYAQGYLKNGNYFLAMKMVLAELEGIQKISERNAVFTCVLTLATPCQDGRQTIEFFQSSISGRVPFEISGTGIGFEPIFIPDGAYKVLARMDAEERQRYCHRCKALNKLIDYLKQQQF